ncbi:hypothetical protein Pfo_028401 [Paulownia fortunei]|nr:hypothetical protein Pfo_028401 [Paulownia fortunei]
MSSRFSILKILGLDVSSGLVLHLAKRVKNEGSKSAICGRVAAVGMGGIGNFTRITLPFLKKSITRRCYYRTNELLEHVYEIDNIDGVMYFEMVRESK